MWSTQSSGSTGVDGLTEALELDRSNVRVIRRYLPQLVPSSSRKFAVSIADRIRTCMIAGRDWFCKRIADYHGNNFSEIV